MAYKRYFYKNGKTYGPYYYESYRDENGKVRKRYVAAPLDKDDKSFFTPTIFNYKLLILFGIFFVLLLGLNFFNNHVYYSKTTGFVVLGNESESEMQNL